MGQGVVPEGLARCPPRTRGLILEPCTFGHGTHRLIEEALDLIPEGMARWVGVVKGSITSIGIAGTACTERG